MTTLNSYIQKYETWLSPVNSSVDERRQRLWLAATLLVAMPAVFFVGLMDLLRGAVVEGAVDMVTALVALGIPFVARQWDRVRPFQRALGVIVLSVLTVEIYSGGGEGYAMVWYYFIPPVFVYLTGVREGGAWAVAGLLLILPGLFNLAGVGTYPLALAVRFVITYVIIGVLAAAAESSRLATLTRMREEHREQERQRATSFISSKPVPLCMSCKRVRDDDAGGTWEGLEEFFSRRMNLPFSHGLCPQCARNLYPDLGLDP